MTCCAGRRKIADAVIAFAMVLLIGPLQVRAEVLNIGGTFSHIQSIVNGAAITEGGGSIDTSYLNGTKLNYLYCVDLFTDVYVPAIYGETSVNNIAQIHGNTVNNAGAVAYLLQNYGAAGQGEQAMALQAAIWTEINGSNVYHLNSAAYGAGSQIVTMYDKYLHEADANSGDVTKLIWLNPANSSSTLYQGLVGALPEIHPNSAPGLPSGAVPEPSTYALMGIGGFLVAYKLKKSRAGSAIPA